jgi:DNA (cytosine-5)-methyltransferase 1
VRPKSGLPKRKALKNMPSFKFGHKDNPLVANLLKSNKKQEKQYTIISMFSGCGGFDLGTEGGFSFRDKYYEKLPFKVVAAYDNDEKACETYQLNLGNQIECVDLTEVEDSDFPTTDILIGGFPCQDFSSCGLKKGLEGDRGRLYKVMARYMKKHKPKIVVAENVPFFLSLHNGAIANEVLTEFRDCGYTFFIWQIYCPDYGLPQSRTRIFLVGYENSLKIKTEPIQPIPTHIFNLVSIDQAIYDLENITDETIPNQSQYFVATKATAGAGQGDQTSIKGMVGYAVRANPKGRVHFHYSLQRRLTVRETARLQSFPDEFIFPHSASKNFMEIGNAVPPIIGHLVMNQILNFIKANNI